MSREDFIFTKQFPQRLYRHIVFWLLYYIFSVVCYFHDGLEKIGFAKWATLEVLEVALHVFTQMIFCYAVLYLLIPKFLIKKKYLAFIGAIILLSTIVFWIYYVEHITLFKAIHTNAGMKFRPPAIVYWFTLISFFTFFPISTGLVTSIWTLKNFYLKKNENQLLTIENANAELQLLKAQIHPHFLFNTLNNIYSFTLSKSPEASSLVSKLSDTIYYMITDCKSEYVTLSKELKMVEDYIGLERVRYGDRLAFLLDIPKDIHNNKIAPLLMIPFVENCFKHGSSMMRGKQWIQLRIKVTGNVLDFTISNSKPVEPVHTKNKTGIGLENVKKRLALLYPGKYQLNIRNTETVYSVQMQIKM